LILVENLFSIANLKKKHDGNLQKMYVP